MLRLYVQEKVVLTENKYTGGMRRSTNEEGIATRQGGCVKLARG